jgi:suppressor for copper-sensitivity B
VTRSFGHISLGWFLVLGLILFFSSIGARADVDENGFRPLGPLNGLLDTGGDTSGREIKLSARFVLDESRVQGVLQVRAQLAPRWHVYSLTQPTGIGAPKASKIIVTESESFRILGDFTPDKPPTSKKLEYVSVPLEEHSDDVIWSARIQISKGVDVNQLVIQGELDGQICEEDGVCIPLSQRETSFAARYDASDIVPSTTPAEEPAGFALLPLLRYLCLGFLAGMLLNLMPCVLPVIGLKIMSFAQQAGEDRGRVVLLNVYFVAGLVTVFMVLACLAVFLGWGWGEQFQSTEFGIVLATIVFVFALSFLGVWEIPIPGFVGSGAAADAAEQEGPLGAFLKGVLTTLLATPCSGPLIVPTLTWALVQTKPVVFGTFLSMGLGMGSPYLLVAFFPSLIRILPKPGAWMETFKHIMGFVLLGTVVWIFSFLNHDYVVPTLGLLFSLWAACWWIGRVPLTEALFVRGKAYVQAAIFAALIGTLSFKVLGPKPELGPPYTPERLASLRESGVTVLVDFTADW